MYTLNFPITVPAEHTFFDNGQYPIPPLPGGLKLTCFSHEGSPLLLRIAGFPAEKAALDFYPLLYHALRVAALDTEHSILLPEGTPVTAAENFDGAVPTVTPTKNNALPYHATASMQSGVHISVLANRIGDALGGAAQKAAAEPGVALAMQLFAECQFAGARNSQVIVLMTALEILVPGKSSSGKRGAVLGFVKKALTTAGHPHPKAAVKVLDDLYIARNALIHEAQPVTADQLTALKQTVRDTLKAVLA